MKGYLDYTISIEVRGYSITKDEISSLLNIECTEFYDEHIRPRHVLKSVENIWTHNLWVYSIETSAELFETSFAQFLENLNLDRLKNSAIPISDVRLHIMVNSSYAQVHLPFKCNQMREISELGIDMDINIVSMGLVERSKDAVNARQLTKRIMSAFARKKKPEAWFKK